jgi:Tetratricopeptide repeat
MRTLSAIAATLLLAGAAPRLTQPLAPVGPAWREDLRLIATELPKRHPDLFYRMPRATWDSAVRSLDRRLPAMTRNQALVQLMELVALPHDGHTTLNPMFDPGFEWRYYPVQFEWLEDGLFIRSAAPEQATLAGARVLRIGTVSTEEALAAAARTLPHENDAWVRAWAPSRLAIPELLDGLGLVADMERLPLVIERAGKRETVTLHPAGRLEPHGHSLNGPIDETGWSTMQVSGELPLWRRHPDRPYWVEYVADTRMLYVCYRGVVDVPPPTNQEFWRSVFALADSVPVDRMVLDLRQNTGGNSFYNRQVVRGIIARKAIDRPDRLFVLIGGRTFSAAMNLVLDLEQWTNATFVGTPTGNATLFFGDHEQMVLPRSGITVNVSTLPWYPSDPRDHRDAKTPSWYTPSTSNDYATGRDPALAAILEDSLRPLIADRLLPLLRSADTVALRAELLRLRDLPINRFRNLEAEVNTLGYARLHAGKPAEAILLFKLNTSVYPSSANTWDSLGEALASAGQSKEAIAAYQKALAVNPGMQSSREALARLVQH